MTSYEAMSDRATRQKDPSRGNGEEFIAKDALLGVNKMTSSDITKNVSLSDEGITPSRFPPFLLPTVPEESPFVWIIINNLLALSGCLLIIEVWYANKYGTTLVERPFAQAFFLIWEFSMCFIWIIESGLSATYQYYHLQAPLKWYNWLELTIAAFFVISTGRMLWEWNFLNYDAAMIWDIALDTSFYMYLVVRNCNRTNEEATISANNSKPETNGEGSYNRMENGGPINGKLV
eukprot:CAMPEP_0194151654 /NCGR_PEP_ID=MMETSP0152-20130528/49171_1 /TAXON_ID=1049557 /ORGANISM="Thalassiothrix antarctica, Strain L6-D1" /LENGTH=233 /DNA_ID=CAMNT_0038855641 /DNA_START=75 /DNA_END=776 /DNA_ORIENTATION=+